MKDHDKSGDRHVDDRRKFLTLLGAAGAGSIAGCSGGGQETTETTEDGETTESGDGSDGMEQWLQEAAADFEGQTVTVVTESTPPSLYYEENEISDFEDITGISVEFQAVSFTEMSNRIVSSATSGQAGLDIAYTEQDSLAAFASNEWLINHTAFRDQNENLAWPDFDIDDFVPFADNFRFPDQDSGYYAYPMESFLKILIYREDIYANEEMSSAYQDEHDAEFSVPSTPDEYMRAAQFIYENSEDILGTQIAGHAAQVQDVTGPYAMVETYFPIHGVYNWGINQDDLTALSSRNGTMNSEDAIEAFNWYRDLLDYAPDGVRNYTWSGPPDAIIAGDAAQGTVYSENLGNMVSGDLAYNPEDLGVALPPVRESVLEDAQNDEGYVGYFDGGGYGVMSASERKEPAYLLLQWLLRPEAQRGLAENVGAVTRNSAIEAAKSTQINEATGYIDFFEENNDLFQGNPNGRVQQVLINEVLQSPFQEFVAGNISAEVCANRWAYNTESKLVELGFLEETGEEPSPM